MKCKYNTNTIQNKTNKIQYRYNTNTNNIETSILEVFKPDDVIRLKNSPTGFKADPKRGLRHVNG